MSRRVFGRHDVIKCYTCCFVPRWARCIASIVKSNGNAKTNQTTNETQQKGTKNMFENYKVFEYELAGRPLKIETGKVAGLANGSAMVHYGDTVILACATAYIERKTRECSRT